MSFTITISDVADKDVGPLIASWKLPRGSSYDLQHRSGEEVKVEVAPKKRKKKGVRRSKADLLVTKLTMTGKRARQPESAVAKGLTHFEMYEGEMGIGTVTVQGFRDFLTRVNMDNPEGIQKRMVRDHYLEYLD